MQIHQDFNPEVIAIRSYSDGIVQIILPITERDEDGKPIIQRQSLSNSSVIIGDKVINPWPVNCVEELKSEHLEMLIELDPEVILVGTGDKLRFPHPSTAQPLLQAGIGVDYMDVGAACRTYNILTAEGRRVAVALILEK